MPWWWNIEERVTNAVYFLCALALLVIAVHVLIIAVNDILPGAFEFL